MENSKNNTIYFIAMTVAMLFWGVAWTSGKIAVAHSNPEVAAFWRYGISLITIIPVIFYLKVPFKTAPKGYVYILLGGLLTALFNYLFFVGVSHGNAGYGGTLVTALAPVITYLLTIGIFKVKVTKKQSFALFIGIVGGIVLLKIPSEGFGFLNIDSIYFLACAAVWSFVTILSQQAAKSTNPLFYTLVAFAITALTNMIFALPYHPFELGSFDTVFWLNIMLMGVFAGSFSTTIFFVSAGKVGAHNAAVFMFIVPVGAIVSSMIVFGEHVELSTVIGCILAFVAVVLFSRKKR